MYVLTYTYICAHIYVYLLIIIWFRVNYLSMHIIENSYK